MQPQDERPYHAAGQIGQPGDVPALRGALITAGFVPLPLFGKAPPAYGKNGAKKGLGGWQHLEGVTPEQIDGWARDWPDAINTGILTKFTPALDLDILNEEAAIAAEDLVRARFEEHGAILVRIGRPPKRAILFRAGEPFAKILANVTAANGSAEKIEFLGDGQQIVVAGVHPETKQPYRWHGGEPGPIRRDELPAITADEARALIEDLIELLARDFGYTRAAKRKGTKSAQAAGGATNWADLFSNVHEGRSLHDSLRALAAKLAKAGTHPGAIVNQLRAMMEASTAPRDDRFRERMREIPHLVDSAIEKYAAPKAPPAPANPAPPCAIADTLAVFDEWLLLPDPTPIYAVLGTVAANLLPGDPVWLGLIAPPSSAKTELLNSISGLPNVVQAATLTVAGLLSGTPKKQHTGGAKGGLLRQIGDFGIISLKDFGSVLSMHTETRAEVLAALREIYDGAWTRHLGSDGGCTLAWKGKVGLLFGATGVYDSHYSVVGTLGDRFLLSRLAPAGRGQFDRALKHGGAGTAQMRKELAEAVARLFAGRRPEPRPIADDEIQFIDSVIMLAVRLRGAIERDRQKREIEAVYGAEGTARIGLALERLLAGLDTLGVERGLALSVVKAVALDSVPPTRRRAYEHLHALRENGNKTASTTAVAEVLALPSVTTRRVLEDLTAYGLIERRAQGQGKADLWAARDWEAEP
jgi:Bifunctional DNA primase/polymerase, N-terminal